MAGVASRSPGQRWRRAGLGARAALERSRGSAPVSGQFPLGLACSTTATAPASVKCGYSRGETSYSNTPQIGEPPLKLRLSAHLADNSTYRAPRSIKKQKQNQTNFTHSNACVILTPKCHFVTLPYQPSCCHLVPKPVIKISCKRPQALSCSSSAPYE